jgi:hypothetical protein
VLDDVNSASKISLYLDIASQIGSPSPDALLLDETQYPINNAQLIEVGDVDGDHFPDILVSGQGTAINGTAYFHLPLMHVLFLCWIGLTQTDPMCKLVDPPTSLPLAFPWLIRSIIVSKISIMRYK